MMPHSVRRGFGNIFGKIGRAVTGARARWRLATSPDRYRPEKHYMRGPGPKVRGQTGRNGRQAGT
jgi:hypothetical protein